MVAILQASVGAGFCPGDCNLDGGVAISELQRSVLISLGMVRMNECLALDLDLDVRGDIEELVAAVNAAVGECDSAIARSFDCPWPDVADGKIHAFVMAGQSNMRGIGIPGELPEHLQRGDPRVVMYHDSWITLRPGAAWFGPEIGFAHAMAEACPNSRIGVLKQTRLATGINSWLREWDEGLAKLVGNPNTGPLYPGLLERVETAGRPGLVIWEGFVWVQGSSDKQNLGLAEHYGENLALLIEAIREDIGAPELPFIFEYRLFSPPVELAARSGVLFEIGPGDKVVELEKFHAQFEIPNAFAANWARLETRDLVHLSSEGYLIGGRLLAESLLRATLLE